MQEVLAGRYELRDILGRGGMGVVYRATDRVLARPVAVKVLPVDRAEDPSLVARFEREALAAAALNHPNVVAVYDTGRDADTRFIVMECVPGQNLAQLLRERGRLPVEEAMSIGAQIAAASAAAHRAGLIHRDIKPANVMVDEAGRVKVLDFGIVRSSTSTSLTETANVIGSAPYLAPELTRGTPADERSDVYSLGCVLYEMLAGRPPFAGELPAAIMHQHNSSQPQPLRELNSAVAPALEALVMAMLAKQPGERPSDVELAEALAQPLDDPTAATAPLTAAAGRTAATTPLVAPTAVTAPVVHDATPLAEATTVLAGATRRLGRRGLAIVAAIAILAIALVALAVTGGSSSPRSRPAAAPRVRSTQSQPATGASAPRASTTTSTPAATAPPAPAPAAGPHDNGHGKGHGNGNGHGGPGGDHGPGSTAPGPPAGKGPHH